MKFKINIAAVVVTAFISFTIISAVGMNGKLNWFTVPVTVTKNIEPVKEESVSSPNQFTLSVDTPPDENAVDLHYPIYDRVTDFLTTPDENSFDLKDPSSIEQSVEY
ncbi:MAG: hypothetical protein LH473_14140, partial [Chitinophagales bacterium]|nr:hypothetical protein [Chitinophagales bacterium]